MMLAAILVLVSLTTTVDSKQSAAEQESATTNEILRLERRLETAIRDGNREAINTIVAADAVFISSTGEELDRIRGTASMITRRAGLAMSTIKEIKVRVYGDSAVVVGLTLEFSRSGGTEKVDHYRWTDVFLRRAGSWQLVSAQSTRVDSLRHLASVVVSSAYRNAANAPATLRARSFRAKRGR
jgi:ketosteroid isomerase-like protein